jgi:hypothetical protein
MGQAFIRRIALASLRNLDVDVIVPGGTLPGLGWGSIYRVESSRLMDLRWK